MGRIQYRNEGNSNFERDYQNELTKCCSNVLPHINLFLDKLKPGLKLEEFLVLPFDEIIALANRIKPDASKENFELAGEIYSKSDLVKWFDYQNCLQKGISKFFMKYTSLFNIQTCYYCEIDFVNAYIPFSNDYFDFYDLINTGNIEDLMKLTGITKPNAKKIVKLCAGKVSDEMTLKSTLITDSLLFNALNSCKNTDNSIKWEVVKNWKNNFTIDHVLPQSAYPYFALCLYNLVPTCYSCNSKLKKQKMLGDLNEVELLSPTSTKFIHPINFKIYYKDPISNYFGINSINQYTIKIEQPSDFTTILNLQGRFSFHKNESLGLIKKRDIYSESHLDELSKLLNRDVAEIKKDIFGSDLFENKQKPFDKYRKDVAKQLGII